MIKYLRIKTFIYVVKRPLTLKFKKFNGSKNYIIIVEIDGPFLFGLLLNQKFLTRHGSLGVDVTLF